jgi:threonine synthase
VAVPEESILTWMAEANSAEGIAFCPESAACVGALKSLADNDWLDSDDTVVIFNTGAVQKYPETIAVDLPELDCTRPVDWDRFRECCAGR